MTIEREPEVNSGAEAIYVFCNNCRDSIGEKILYHQHNGYGEDAKPLNGEQKSEAEKIARQHDRQNKETHSIRIVIYKAKPPTIT